MSIAYGYGLVSADDSGLSLRAQSAELRAYYDRHLLPSGTVWGHMYADRGDSAPRLDLADHPAGKALVDRVRRGDHVLLVRLDRGFSREADAFDCLTRWLESGVHLHLTRHGLDVAAVGETFLRAIEILTDFKRTAKDDRARRAHRRREGSMVNQYAAGYGYKLAGRRGRRRKVPDYEERKLIRFIAELHDERGLSFEQIYLHFWKHKIRTRTGKEWSISRIQRVYAALARPVGGTTPGDGLPAA